MLFQIDFYSANSKLQLVKIARLNTLGGFLIQKMPFFSGANKKRKNQ